MGRRNKWPQGRGTMMLEMSKDQESDIDRARELLIVETPSGRRPMNRSEFAREALRYLVERLRLGRCRVPKKKLPEEWPVVEVGEWAKKV